MGEQSPGSDFQWLLTCPKATENYHVRTYTCETRASIPRIVKHTIKPVQLIPIRPDIETEDKNYLKRCKRSATYLAEKDSTKDRIFEFLPSRNSNYLRSILRETPTARYARWRAVETLTAI